jgi:hypothetical protein
MRSNIVSTALCILFVSIPGFSQTSTNAQLTGVVTDTSGALIPGVTITATKADTGVITTALTNETGVYTFQALQPGSGYTVSAMLPGFQTLRYTNLELSAAVVSRQNFQLQVATQATTVDVSIDRTGALLESSPSVGDVLPEYRIKNLPLVGNNVLDLLNILPGVRFNGTGQWMGDYANTVAGQGLNSLNVTLDGLPTRDERFSAQAGTFQGESVNGTGTGAQSGAFFSDYTGGNRMLSTTTINPDLVGEIRLILSPVDAEMGRGNSQIQITTRSGTNRYTGSAVWNIQNTALNPNTWNNNNDVGSSLTGCKIEGQTPPCWNPTQPNWRNTHQYTISYGGPIIRNKTFFYVLWDQQISNTRSVQTNTVLTDSARNGIYKYWEGWVSGNANATTTAVAPNSVNPTTASVDFSGNPQVPTSWPSGAAYNGSQAGVPAGRLMCFSIFGNTKADGSPFGAADCPGGTDGNGRSYAGVALLPSGALWDTKRPDAATAQLGYFARILQEMPRANYFAQGDGLNTSGFRWLLGRKGDGAGVADAVVGSAAFQNRKQINIKIDQNFKTHRFAGSWTHQYDNSTDPAAQWPNGVSGLSTRGPHTFTVNVTSTFSSSLLNEGRFGLNLNSADSTNPWNLSDSAIRDRARSFFLAGGSSLSGNGNIYDILVSPQIPAPPGPFSVSPLSFDNGLMFTAGATENQFNNPLYNVADTVSWTHGKHAFKFGADLRFPRSKGNSLQPIPVAQNGNLGGTNTESPFANVGNSSSLGSTGTPSATNPEYSSNLFPQNARNLAANIAYIMTNSLGTINTPYWAENYAQVSAGTAGWQDVTTQQQRIREMVYTDYAVFAKDDFKIRKDLTLNLGIRYEYYAPPYITSGLTSTVVDQGDGLFGVGRGVGAGFDTWLSPGNLYFTGYGTNGTGNGTNGLGNAAISLSCSSTAVGTLASRLPAPNCDPNLQSNIEFIGPNSPNPGKTIIPRDRNNFGPAVGFAWQLPWFGEGRTTVRGGYQLTFQRVEIGESTLASALGGFLNQTASQNDPAIQNIAQATGQNRAVLLTDLQTLVPVPPSRAPGQTVPVYGRSQSFTAYSADFATPYTQNLTLSVTRALSRSLSLDVRYVGSLTRKTAGSLNLNTSTALYNQELFDAFDAARRGENPALLDQLLAGVDIAPGAGNNTTWTFGTNTGIYPTDRMYGPVGTCTTLATAPPAGGVTFTTPTGFPDDPHCAPGQMFNYGGDALRRASVYGTSGPLGNGSFAALANVLAGTTAPTGGLVPITTPAGGTTPAQRVLRNGCDRIANGYYDPSQPAVYPTVEPRAVSVAGSPTFGVVTANIPTRCFPENYLVANPQLNNATYASNLGRNNFHSLQVGFTMRPIHGISLQSNYTWAKSMTLPSSGYNDPLNREFDHQMGNERAHDFRLNGTLALPIGPNKLFFANTSGWVARIIEDWQTSFILNLSTGSPASATGAATTRYAGNGGFQPIGQARWVPTEFWKIPKGHVDFENAPTGTGTYYGNSVPGAVGTYVNVPDPQCSDSSQVSQVDNKGFAFAANANGCTLRALGQRVPVGTPGSFLIDPTNPAEVAAVHVLVNPKPGEYGVLSPNVLTSFGNWSLDANAQKTFRISESKSVSIRIDATNVLNHPTPFIPYFQPGGQFGSGQFGEILCGCNDSKSGTRTFQGQVRFSF